MSMMEIYNEAVYDLLGKAQKSSPGPAGKTSLDIRQNAAGGTSVPGLTEVMLVVCYFILFFLCVVFSMCVHACAWR